MAAYLGCSQRHLFNLRRRGMPSYRIGDMIRFDPERVIEWIESSGMSNPPDPRSEQLAAIAAEGSDASECARADLAREFPNLA